MIKKLWKKENIPIIIITSINIILVLITGIFYLYSYTNLIFPKHELSYDDFVEKAKEFGFDVEWEEGANEPNRLYQYYNFQKGNISTIREEKILTDNTPWVGGSFIVYDTKSEADSLFNIWADRYRIYHRPTNKKYIKRSHYEFYSCEIYGSKKTYNIMVRVGNSVISIETTLENKEEADNFIKALGY